MAISASKGVGLRTQRSTWLAAWGADEADQYWPSAPDGDWDGVVYDLLTRGIVFFNTVGITHDMSIYVFNNKVPPGCYSGGSAYVAFLNGNGAEYNYDKSIYGWMRGRFSPEYYIGHLQINDLTCRATGELLIPASHINSEGYTAIISVLEDDYNCNTSPSEDFQVTYWRPTSAKLDIPNLHKGYIWVEDTNLAYTSGGVVYAKRTLTGTLDGATGQTPGHLWVEGNNLRYIDSSGAERYLTGTLDGATGQTPSFIWIEGTGLRYIDSSGNERYLVGS